MSETIHQALHGYREGHRLLASSLDLSAADRQRLAEQTDNSDAGRSGEWQGLLAGYPLPSGLYAWSMTWPAPEMPRPGCVWTHTLLLDPASYALPEPETLLSLFSRPSDGFDPSAYGRKLSVSNDGSERLVLPTGKEARLVTALLWSVYEPPFRPVRATGIRWTDHERHLCLLTLWLQQWDELRRNTSLADAPATPRRLNGADYDLQLHRSARAQRRRETERVIAGVPTAKPPAWASAAAGDLAEPNGLSSFLHAYGSDAGADRSAFSALVRIWLALGSSDAEAALGSLAELFPEAKSGTRIKRDVLGRETAPSGCAETLSDASVLRAALSSADADAFPPETLAIPDRLHAVLDVEPSLIADLVELLDSNQGPVSDEVANVLTDPSDPSVGGWLRSQPGDLTKLIAVRPEFAASPELWRRVDAGDLWPAVKSIRGRNRRVEILSAVVETGVEVDPEAIFAAWPDSQALLLDALARTDDKKAIRRWLNSVQPEVVGKWVRQREGSLPPATASIYLSRLESHEIRQLSPSFVADQLAGSESVELAAKCFAASIASSRKRGWAVVGVASFTRLCRPKARLSPSATKHLADFESDLPKSASWQERIARLLNQAFQDDYWDPLTSLELDRYAFERLIEADKKAGLARRIVVAGADQNAQFDAWQTDELLENIEARADKASLFQWGKNLLRSALPF